MGTRSRLRLTIAPALPARSSLRSHMSLTLRRTEIGMWRSLRRQSAQSLPVRYGLEYSTFFRSVHMGPKYKLYHNFKISHTQLHAWTCPGGSLAQVSKKRTSQNEYVMSTLRFMPRMS